MAATPAIVRVLGQFHGGGSGPSLTTSAATAAGNAIVMLTSYSITDGTVTVSDSAGNVYARAADVYLDEGSGTAVYVCLNALSLPAGGSITVTCSLTIPVPFGIAIEVSNLTSVASVAYANSFGSIGNTPITQSVGPSAAVTQPNVLALAAFHTFVQVAGGPYPAVTHTAVAPYAQQAVINGGYTYSTGGTTYYRQFTLSLQSFGLTAASGAQSASASISSSASGTNSFEWAHAILVLNGPPNRAPNAPTLTHRTGLDATQPAAFVWAFSDPDAGDTQSAYQLVITAASGGATLYDSGKVTSAANSLTLAANTLPQNTACQWTVKTWDAAGLAGTYASLDSFITSAAPTAAITTPTAGAVLTSQALTAAWSYSSPTSLNASAYRLRLLLAGVAVFDSGKVLDGVTLSRAVTPANATSYTAEITVWDSNDTASTPATVAFSTLFQVPHAPLVSIALSPDGGAIRLTLTPQS